MALTNLSGYQLFKLGLSLLKQLLSTIAGLSKGGD